MADQRHKVGQMMDQAEQQTAQMGGGIEKAIRRFDWKRPVAETRQPREDRLQARRKHDLRRIRRPSCATAAVNRNCRGGSRRTDPRQRQRAASPDTAVSRPRMCASTGVSSRRVQSPGQGDRPICACSVAADCR